MENLYKEILFWVFFLICNFNLFAFNYAIQIHNTRFFPVSIRGLKVGRKGFFISSNNDFFRLSIDISLGIFLYRFQVIDSGILIFSLLYTFIFLFNIYHFSFAYIYKTMPVIANDAKLLKDGMAILFQESKAKFIMYSSGTLLLLCLVFVAFRRYIAFSSAFSPLPATYVLALALLIIFVIAVARKGFYNNRQDLRYRFLFQAARLGAHIINSYRLHNRKARWEKNIPNLKSENGVRYIHTKPNIYLIFVESYGALLLKENALVQQYKAAVEGFSSRLQDNGWQVKNNLSESVSLIGPSWLAYSSFLYGCRIDNHLIYEHLLKSKTFHQADCLLKQLRHNGYTVFNLNPTKGNKALNVPMENLTSFYHVDQWILRDDIDYRGLEYGFGEFPADQYTLNYAYDHYLKDCPSPFVLFYLTKNSHSPFVSPKIVADDWRKINDQAVKSHSLSGGFLKRPNMKDFFDSIVYQFQVLQNYIIKNGRDNDIFLLMGDHQPHELSDENQHGLETIVHVISKDKAFVEGFEAYGFRDSLFDGILPVKHEGLHSAFVREFLRCYGVNNEKLPEYEPHGHQLF